MLSACSARADAPECIVNGILADKNREIELRQAIDYIINSTAVVRLHELQHRYTERPPTRGLDQLA
jgi:hypothetical protein